MGRAERVLFCVFVALALVAILIASLYDSSRKSSSCSSRHRRPRGPTCRGYRWAQCNVVSDIGSMAETTDADVVNAWGVALAPCCWLNRPASSSSSSSDPCAPRAPRPCAPCAPSSSSSSSPPGQHGRSVWVALNGSGLLVEYELTVPADRHTSGGGCCPPAPAPAAPLARLRSVTVPAATTGTGFPTGVIVNCVGGFNLPPPATGPAPLIDPAPPADPPAGLSGPRVVTAPALGAAASSSSSSSSAASSLSARVITATEDGLIAGWSPNSNPAAAVVMVTSASAVYKGLALLEGKLYVANFNSGHVEIYDDTWAAAGTFTDPALLAIGYAPFNVTAIGGQLYVSFAKQDGPAHDDVAGAGNGFIDVFDSTGLLVKRLVNRGPLNSPWAMAAYDDQELLVGNFGDGRINRFALCSGRFLGPLTDSCCRPISIDGLWGVACAISCKRIQCGPCRPVKHVDDPRQAAAPPQLIIAAGPNAEQDGLIAILNRLGRQRCCP